MEITVKDKGNEEIGIMSGIMSIKVNRNIEEFSENELEDIKTNSKHIAMSFFNFIEKDIKVNIE